jgi:hypothetical protein
MPCNCDHLNPTTLEIEIARAARLLNFVRSKVRLVPSKLATENSDPNRYPTKETGDIITEQLCTLLGKMSKGQQEKIVYNAHDAVSRDLASWWAAHQAADKAREEQERAVKAKKKLREQGLSKLTKKERDALGL